MNTRRLIGESSGPISLSVAFNQDASCFAVGHETGFCVFNQGCEITASREFNAGFGKVEMLDRSNAVALVGGGRRPKYPQNKVVIWDDSKRKPAIILEMRTSVLGVRMSKSKIVAVLQNSVHIYEFANPPKKQYVFETADNIGGLCCLREKVVAFPGQTPGKVQLVELANGNVSIIPAHDTPLRVLDLSADGELLATASEKGTLIRIFSTANSAKIVELRRGVDQAIIYSIKISPNGKMLAASSDKSTLHVFDIPDKIEVSETPAEEKSAPSKWGFLSKIPFLPRTFSDNYSFTSAAFSSDDDPNSGADPTTATATVSDPIPGIPGGRAPKGILGWLDDNTIISIGAGRDGRWERFALNVDEDGHRVLSRAAWKRYFRGSWSDSL